MKKLNELTILELIGICNYGMLIASQCKSEVQIFGVAKEYQPFSIELGNRIKFALTPLEK